MDAAEGGSMRSQGYGVKGDLMGQSVSILIG